ncbi:hypothetical protein Q5752_002165 [Cryptotrichosporon argae]
MLQVHLSSPIDIKPDAVCDSLKPVTPPSKKRKASTTKRPKTPSKPEGSDSSASSTPTDNGAWTPEKKAAIVDRIFATGYKNVDLDALAAEFGLSRLQIKNQLAPGRTGSLRDKAVKAARGE